MAWRDQWATLYWAVWGPVPWAREDVTEEIAPILRPYFTSTQQPKIETLTPQVVVDEYDEAVVKSGPFAGTPLVGEVDPDTFDRISVGGPYLTAVKWNVRDKDGRPLTGKRMGEIRAQMRGDVVALRREINDSRDWESINWGLQLYGKPIAGDVGVPKTPNLPRRPRQPADEPVAERRKPGIWPWIAAAAAAAGTVALAAKGGGKRRYA